MARIAESLVSGGGLSAACAGLIQNFATYETCPLLMAAEFYLSGSSHGPLASLSEEI